MDDDINPLLGVGQRAIEERQECDASSLASSMESFPDYRYEVSEMSTNDSSWFHHSDLGDTSSDEEGWFSSFESYEDSKEYVFIAAKDCIPTGDSSEEAPLTNRKGKTRPFLFDDEKLALGNRNDSELSPKESVSEVVDKTLTSEVFMGEDIQVDCSFDRPSLSKTKLGTVTQTFPGIQKLRIVREPAAKCTTALQKTLGKACQIAPIRQGATFVSFLGRGTFSAGSNAAAAMRNRWNNGILRSLRENLVEAGDIVLESIAALPRPEDSIGVRHRRRLF